MKTEIKNSTNGFKPSKSTEVKVNLPSGKGIEIKEVKPNPRISLGKEI